MKLVHDYSYLSSRKHDPLDKKTAEAHLAMGKFMHAGRQRQAIVKARIEQAINKARLAVEEIKRRKEDAKKEEKKSKDEVTAAFQECKLKFLELVLKQATYEARSDIHDELGKAWLTMRGRLYRMRRGLQQAQSDATTTEADEEEEDASGE